MRNPFPRIHQGFNDLFMWIEVKAAPKQPYVDHDEPVGNEHDPEQWPKPLVLGDTTMPYHYWVTEFEPGKSVTLELHPDNPEGRPPRFILHTEESDPRTPEMVADGWKWTASPRQDPQPWKIQLEGPDGTLGAPILIPAQPPAEPMDAWLAWALPAIFDVLAAHTGEQTLDDTVWCCNRSDVGLDHDDNVFEDWQAWREHVAPIVAARIACDPKRALAALQTLL